MSQLNKQQKIFLFVIVPVMMSVIVIFTNLLFGGKDKKEEELQGNINTQLPSVANNIQGEKASAYEREGKTTQKKDNSDFVLGDYDVLNDNSTNEVIDEDIVTPEQQNTKKTDKTGKTTQQMGKGREERMREARQQLDADREAIQEFDDDDVYDSDAIEQTRNKRKQIQNKKNPPPRSETKSLHKGIGFNSITLNKNTKTTSKESGGIAFIHGEQTVYQGSNVKIRTGDPIPLPNGEMIPANSFLYGICSFAQERLQIKISRFQNSSKILSCDLIAYGMDGNTGIYVPGSVQKDENKKAGSKGLKKVGNVLGSGISIATGGVLGGIAETATESVIDAVADGSAKSVQQRKVLLPNNEKIYLK